MSEWIQKKEDKFHNKTELVTKVTSLWSASKLYDYGLSWQRNDIKAKFRYWSTPDGDSVLLDLDYGGPDWLFLRDGDIVIRINNAKNIQLKPSEEDTNVSSNEGNKITCREVLHYEIDKNDFKDICAANIIELQISGAHTFVIGDAENLQNFARILYDNLYEPIYKISPKEPGNIPLSILLSTSAITASLIMLIDGCDPDQTVFFLLTMILSLISVVCSWITKRVTSYVIFALSWIALIYCLCY